MWRQRDSGLRQGVTSVQTIINTRRSTQDRGLHRMLGLFGTGASRHADGQKADEHKSLGSSGGVAAGSAAAAAGDDHEETQAADGGAVEEMDQGPNGGREETPTAPMAICAEVSPKDADENRLAHAAGDFGDLAASCLLGDSRRKRKFCFRDPDIPESVAKVVAELSGLDTDLYRRPASDCMVTQCVDELIEASLSLYIENLSEPTTDASLRALFEPFGTITSCVAVQDGQGRCKGFGFVAFEWADEAAMAVREMNLKVVRGEQLHVSFAEPRDMLFGEGLCPQMSGASPARRGQQAQRGQPQPPEARSQPQQPPALRTETEAGMLTATTALHGLAAPPDVPKQELAGKVMRMMSAMGPSLLVESELQLRSEVEEALRVLEEWTWLEEEGHML